MPTETRMMPVSMNENGGRNVHRSRSHIDRGRSRIHHRGRRVINRRRGRCIVDRRRRSHGSRGHHRGRIHNRRRSHINSRLLVNHRGCRRTGRRIQHPGYHARCRQTRQHLASHRPFTIPRPDSRNKGSQPQGQDSGGGDDLCAHIGSFSYQTCPFRLRNRPHIHSAASLPRTATRPHPPARGAQVLPLAVRPSPLQQMTCPSITPLQIAPKALHPEKDALTELPQNNKIQSLVSYKGLYVRGSRKR